MRILYFGDGIWAQRALEKIIANREFDVAGVVLRYSSQDMQLGAIAEKHHIPVYRFEKVNSGEVVTYIKGLQIDLGVSMSYDQIIGEALRKTAAMGFINCHAGKLPDYRGRNVLNWVLINGEKEFGITVHFIDEGIDTGDIISQVVVPVCEEDDYGTLLQKAYEICPELLVDALIRISADNITTVKQDHLSGSYFSCRRIGDEFIDWNWPARRIYDLIRAITKPGPGAYTYYKNKKVYIWKAELTDMPEYVSIPGEVIGRIQNRGNIIKTGDSAILIRTVSTDDQETLMTPEFPVGSRLCFNMSIKLLELEERIDKIEKRMMADE